MNNGRRVELDVTYNNAPFAGQVGAATPAAWMTAAYIFITKMR